MLCSWKRKSITFCVVLWEYNGGVPNWGTTFFDTDYVEIMLQDVEQIKIIYDFYCLLSINIMHVTIMITLNLGLCFLDIRLLQILFSGKPCLSSVLIDDAGLLVCLSMKLICSSMPCPKWFKYSTV